MKGAFTGADKDKIGIFEQARGGTVFLDEIHHLCHAAQAKLLRVLQDGKIRRVGDYREREVNFSLVCAGKPELNEMVRQKKFLLDLYYRICFIDIQIPPLRERIEDIGSLVNYFCGLNEKKHHVRKVFANSALKALKLHNWPGNVRELEATVEALFVMNEKRAINASDINTQLRFEIKDENLSDTATEYAILNRKHRNEQKLFLLNALKKASFNVTKAASELSLARTTLISRMKKLGIDGVNKNDLSNLYRKEVLGHQEAIL